MKLLSHKKDFCKMLTPAQLLDDFKKKEGLDFFARQVPAYINSNIGAGYIIRPYQQEAFGRFIYYYNQIKKQYDNTPMQLLFHMATGSGKTLVMAGLILYLYEKGFRHFLFFVNSNNIIDKTRDNFLNRRSSKYLFADQIFIGEKNIRIREVNNFQDSANDDIQIVFTTIQGLHSRLTVPRENALTYTDFEGRPIVLISDEAHHINAETKKGNEISAEEKATLVSWEGTVNKILQSESKNILLEFTATADLNMPFIKEKYSNKLLFDYPLKQFRKDGYSKEVKVLQSDLTAFERALQSILLSQYRRKIFEKNRLAVKPVILFKSKTIKESQVFFYEFIQRISTLSAASISGLRQNGTGILQKIFLYLDKENISIDHLVAELKEDFSADKLISVNSKEESVEKQIAINSLEDEFNPYRAVFAVDKLNEGWDVLNLFDIVRFV